MINGLDICAEYQEQALYGKFIDWPALKADPLGFRFIWIKCAEGTDGTNYIDGAACEVTGALSVHFEAINPYHYYLFQWCDWSSGAAVWRVISAAEQAQAFFDASKASGFLAGFTPMLDWEDPLIDQFLQWSDTTSINKAIQFALKLNAHLKAYTYAVRDLFGKLPNPYSGKWWLDKWVPLLVNNGYSANVEWLKELYYILADYDGTLNIPSYIPADHVIAWQKTSSPVPPVNGIPTGRIVPGDALDIDEWLLDEPAFLKWSNQEKEVTTMAGINDINVKLSDREWFGWISADDKNVDMTGLCAGVDGLFLNMCSQQVSGMTIAKDGAFPVYAARATKPIPAVVTMDQDLFWKKEIDLDKFKLRDMWNNETIRAIIDQWRSTPIPVNDWNIHKLNITASDGGWLPISAIILYMATTINPTHGSHIGGSWQQAIVTDITKVLTTLMQGGYIPTVKIYVAADDDWYGQYVNDTGWEPMKNGHIAGLGILRQWGKEVDGLPTEKGQMATPAATVAELRQYLPSDNFVYPAALKSLTFDFFVYTYNRLASTGMFYAGAPVTPLTAGVCAGKSFLGAATPPVLPPSDFEARITALEADVTMLETQVAQDAVTLAKIREYLHNLDNTIILGITPFEG